MSSDTIQVGAAAPHLRAKADAQNGPLGYRRTELGVIAEDWESKQLKEIADFANGKPHERNVVQDGKYKLVTLDSIGIDGKLKPEHKATNVSDNSLNRNDIVAILSDIAHGNLLGLCDLIPSDDTYVLNQRVGRIRIKSGADPQFIRLQINQQQKHFKQRGQGTSQRHVYRRDFESLYIPYPRASEQRAIAEALSDVDALLGSLAALIAKKRAIKQVAMQQLLTGKTRLPGFSGEWEVKRLGEIAEFFKGSGLSKADLKTNGDTRCIHYGELFTLYGESITEVVSRTDATNLKFHSMANDVLMPTSDVTPNGLATASCIAHPGIALGGDILVIRSSPKIINGEFLAYAIKVNHKRVMQLVTGTTVFHLYGRDMANFEFAAPCAEEQSAISTILSDMDLEIAVLESRRDKTRAIKQGMMQQLLTGRIRLVEAQAA